MPTQPSDFNPFPSGIELGRETAQKELEEARREAEQLATSIWKTEFREQAPEWELCDSAAGVITQIDNMYAGIRQQRDEARFGYNALHRRISHLEAALDKLARLGNEPHLGNSVGNTIAREALKYP